MGVIVLRYACVFLMGSFKKHSIYPLGNLTSESLLLVLRSFVISQDICLTQPSKSIGVGFHVSLSEFLFYMLCLPHKCNQKKHGSLWSSCASRYSRCTALFAQTNFILTQIWACLWKNNLSKSFNTIGTWFTRRAHRKISFFSFLWGSIWLLSVS